MDVDDAIVESKDLAERRAADERRELSWRTGHQRVDAFDVTGRLFDPDDVVVGGETDHRVSEHVARRSTGHVI